MRNTLPTPSKPESTLYRPHSWNRLLQSDLWFAIGCSQICRRICMLLLLLFYCSPVALIGQSTRATRPAPQTVSVTTPTITWATPAAITYGTALSATQLNATSSVAGTFVYTPASGTILNSWLANALGHFHPDRHHRLHDRNGHRQAHCEQGHAHH